MIHKVFDGQVLGLVLRCHDRLILSGLRGFGRGLLSKEEFVIVVEDKVVNLLLDTLHGEPVHLIPTSGSHLFLLNYGLYDRRCLLWLEQTSLEWFVGVEEALLRGEGLLVLKHLFRSVVRDLSQAMDVHLNLVLIELKLSEDCQHRADCDILVSQPGTEVILPFVKATILVVIIQPQDTGHDTR